MRTSLCVSTLLLSLSLHSVWVVNARPTFVQRIPNGNSVVGVRAIGHQNPNGGGATNVFGEAFKAAGTQWTQELCHGDADGDGATNGEELGDPCCTWQPGGIPSRTTSITHPGVAQSFSAADLATLRCAQDAATSTNPPTTAIQPVVEPTSTAAASMPAATPATMNHTTPPEAPTNPTTTSKPTVQALEPIPSSEQDRVTTKPSSGEPASSMGTFTTAIVVLLGVSTAVGLL